MFEVLLAAVVMMGGLGVITGVLLAFASKIFYVYVDPIILEVEGALPGANCGGCGFPGCSANAAAIVAGTSAPNSCVAGDAELAQTIAAILGVSVEAKEPDIAAPGCTYGLKKADVKFTYDGLNDCRAAVLLNGGMKTCAIGCLGLGTCMRACPFNAIAMGPEGLPVVDEKRCTGCGTCERACPRHIINLSSVTRRILREYTTENCTTPCQRACPAGIDICEYIHQISIGDYSRALQVIKERNPFPTVIGRICPRPCEDMCRRGLTDEPVAINALKRFVADIEMNTGKRLQPYKAPATNRRMAIIGGGVQGLSAAFFLARLGHSPTVFEATDKAGGLLRSAIAANRLSMDVLDWDIQGVLDMGVALETGRKMGSDISIHSLLNDQFETVFLSTGGWDNRLARGTGAQAESTMPGGILLIDLVRSGRENRFGLTIGSDAVILNAGKLAIEAADVLKRMGAKSITAVFRETREQLISMGVALDALGATGAEAIFEASVNRVLGEYDSLTGIELIVRSNGEKRHIPAQTLLPASGRFPELIFKRLSSGNEPQDAEKKETGQWEGIPAYKQPAFYKEQGLLAEGDPLTDFNAAIRAIAAGRRAAASIHKVMYGIPLDLSDKSITPLTVIQTVERLTAVKPVKRGIMPLAPVDQRASDADLELGFSEKTALAESSRCLRCGLICYEHTAADMLPMASNQ